jgi:tetratricopeptide (TPR) repeat protein
MDKAAAIRNAQKYLAKGQLDKAITEWESVASTFPEGNTFNYLGDLYLKQGQKDKALVTYHKAAKVYMDEGFTLKALAIYKKVLNVNRNDPDALIALGELSEQKSITTDAIKYYLQAADVLSKDNKKPELMAVYNKIVRLAPSNLNLRLKIAEIFSKEGFTHEAANEYFMIGSMLLDAKKLDAAREYLMKSLEIRPSNRATLLALSRLSEEKGDLAQAENYVHIAIERTGEEPELLLRNAHILLLRGQMDGAVAEIQKVVRNNPGNIEARRELASLYEQAGQLDKAWEQHRTIIDSLVDTGATDEAIAILSSFREFDPVSNGRRLATLFRLSGQEEAAVGELTALYEMYMAEGATDEALAVMKEAFEIQPYNSELKEKITALDASSALEEEPALDASMSGMPSVELPGAAEGGLGEEVAAPARPRAGEDEKPVEVQLAEADTFLKFGLFGDARKVLEKLRISSPENVEVHVKLKDLYLETNDGEQAITECLILSTLASRRKDAAGSRAFLVEACRIDPADPRLDGRATDDIRDEARREAGPATGDMEPPAIGVPSAGEEYEDFTLDSLIEASKVEVPDEEQQRGDYNDDVFDIFNEFKKGLAKEIAIEDAETHYNLGIAYKEMGLIDDSIKEFQTSRADPDYAVQSFTMLGICFKEKGLLPLAVEAFKSALKRVAATDDTVWSIKYDLAEVHEGNNNLADALGLFTEVYGWNSKYRDVAAKVTALSASVKSGGPPPPPAGGNSKGKEEAQPQEKAKEKRSRVSYI